MKKCPVNIYLLLVLMMFLLAGCSDSDGNNTTSPPPQVSSVTVTPADTQLTVTWAAVQGATSYKVYYNTANDSSTATEFTGDSNTADTTCIITGLTNGTSYYVWAKAINSAGSSDFSTAPSPGVPIAAVTIPTVPASPVVTAGDTQLTVSWAAVTGATSYKVYFNTANNSSTATEFTGDSNTADTTCTITGLTNGTPYYVWVKAVNSAGSSAYSTVSSPGTPFAAVTVPTAPVSLAVTPADTQLTVTWAAATGATSYKVYFNTANNSSTATEFTGDSNAADTSCIITSLANGTPYYVWVKAVNSAGSSNFSSAAAPATPVAATAGSLDTTFGTSGKVTTAFTSSFSIANSVAVQSDGKIVSAGQSGSDFALARYNADGSPDTGFGTAGKVVASVGTGTDYAKSVAIQSDGKIVAAGSLYVSSSSKWVFAVARFNANGSPDTTFDTDGFVTTPFGNWAYINSIAIQSDGKIVAAGYTQVGATYDIALARYNADGSLDTGFGSSGIVTTVIGSGDDEAFSVAIQPDGKIVVAGNSSNGTNRDFALVRYTAAGALDPGFGSGGKVVTTIGSGNDQAYSVAIQSDGKIVAAGYTNNSSNNDFALVRYTAAGALDTGFGSGGKVVTPIGVGNDQATSIAIQSDGKIVATGYTNNGSNNDFALVRYTAAGALDTGFGSGGKVVTPIGLSYDEAYGVAIQSDGKIVAVGISNNGATDSFAVVRYNY